MLRISMAFPVRPSIDASLPGGEGEGLGGVLRICIALVILPSIGTNPRGGRGGRGGPGGNATAVT